MLLELLLERIDFTGGHVFECYVAGEADKLGVLSVAVLFIPRRMEI